MTKQILIFLFTIALSGTAFAESYFFKDCRISSTVLGDYFINLDKKLIEVTLRSSDGQVQNFADEIRVIEKNQIISEKIESGKGDDVYFEYYLNSKAKSVIKFQYKKESGIDLDIFKLQRKRESFCLDVKASWDKDKIEKAEIAKEQNEILKAQRKIKKAQSKKSKCSGNDYKKWNNCKGTFKTEIGHKYDGLFKNGQIIKGIALFPGGAKYVGDFINLKPHGYGNFSWINGDKYMGEWKNGKSHGSGTKIWNDGREYSGDFENDKPHGSGIFYYLDGKSYEGEFLNGKRHGEGTFTYPDGTLFVGKFVEGKQKGLGTCVAVDGSNKPCESKSDVQAQNFSGKDIRTISIVAKKWIRISQYEANIKKGKKVTGKLKKDFETKAKELCSPKNYIELKKIIEILDVDETPAYGLETKVQIGISGVVECK